MSKSLTKSIYHQKIGCLVLSYEHFGSDSFIRIYVCILNIEQMICNDDGECCCYKLMERKVIEKRGTVRMVAKQGIFRMIVPETESGGNRKKGLNQIYLHRIDYIFLAPSNSFLLQS